MGALPLHTRKAVLPDGPPTRRTVTSRLVYRSWQHGLREPPIGRDQAWRTSAGEPLFGGGFDVLEDGVEVADGLYGLESDEIGLDLGPLAGVLFGDDGRLGVGVVGEEVVFDLGGDWGFGMFGELGQEEGVGLVGEGIAAGFDLEAGVEVAVGKVLLDGVVVIEDEAERPDGVIDAADVKAFGVLGGALDGEEFEKSYFGQDEDKAGVDVAADAGRVAILLPVVVGRGLQEISGEGVEVWAGDVFGEVLSVEDGFGAGDIGEEAAGGEAVGAKGDLTGADDFGQLQAVGLVEGFGEQDRGDFEADVTEIGGGSEAALGELVDVEGELGLDVGVWVLGVVDVGAVALLEAGKLDGDGEVDGGAVAYGIAEVVGEGADGEGEFVGGLSVAEEREDEVAGADVVGEVGEELVAEGVVAEVLDGATAVGIAVSLLKLGGGEGGEALEQDGLDGGFPGEVDELFVGLDGVGNGGRGRAE